MVVRLATLQQVCSDEWMVGGQDATQKPKISKLLRIIISIVI